MDISGWRICPDFIGGTHDLLTARGKNTPENQSSAEQIDHYPKVFKMANGKAIFSSRRINCPID
jgi:hypothetical protein